MKDLNKILTEKLQINKNSKEGEIPEYYNRYNIDKNLKYGVVFPNGYFEFFTQDGLDEMIRYIKSVLKKRDADDEEDYSELEDELITYQELNDLDKINEWVEISGPAGYKDEVLKGTIGIKYKK